MNNDMVELTGVVKQILPNANYSVLIDKINKTSICYLSGKMTKRNIKPEIGDKVTIEIYPLDITKGRIINKIR